jgi:3-isopropylmalate/(R)-2-methylmalate dehydratase small subunit
MTLLLRGRCWKFGDNVAVDGDLMPLEFALKREIRPEFLKDHLFCGLDPGFAQRARAGDLIVAGRRFAQGNPHIQGLLGIRGAGLGLVVESIPSGSFRNAVNAGVPFLPRCDGVTGLVQTGDDLEVDFASGRFVNHTRGVEQTFPALPRALLDIIAVGGWRAAFERRLARRPA